VTCQASHVATLPHRGGSRNQTIAAGKVCLFCPIFRPPITLAEPWRGGPPSEIFLDLFAGGHVGKRHRFRLVRVVRTPRRFSRLVVHCHSSCTRARRSGCWHSSSRVTECNLPSFFEAECAAKAARQIDLAASGILRKRAQFSGMRSESP
jgi:hypothetical protein